MKIDFSASISRYQKNAGYEHMNKKVEIATDSKAKTDVASFSRSSAGTEKVSAPLRALVIHELNTPASQERLQNLQQSIREGTYRVPTEALVSAILDA